MRKRCLACTVGFMFIVCFAGAFAGEGKNPSAMELLDRYAESLDASLSFIEYYEDTQNASNRSVFGSSRGKGFKRGQIRFDGQNILKYGYHWGHFNSRLTNLPEDKPHYRCMIVNDKMCYQNTKLIGDDERAGKVLRSPRPKDDMDVSLARIFGTSYLSGYISSDERLDKLLREADRISVRRKTETINSSECFVIDADTKYGRYVIWFDPEHGFHPAKVRHYAREGDYSFSHLLLKGETTRTYVKNVRFEKIDGIWVPMEADAGTDIRAIKGHFSKEYHHYKRTKFILNPDHEKLGSFADPILENASNDPELKEGDRVRLTKPGYESVKFKWQGKDNIPELEKAAD